MTLILNEYISKCRICIWYSLYKNLFSIYFLQVGINIARPVFDILCLKHETHRDISGEFIYRVSNNIIHFCPCLLLKVSFSYEERDPRIQKK